MTTPSCRCWFTLALRQGNLGRGRKEGEPRGGKGGAGGGGGFGHLCVSSFAHGVHAGYLPHTSVMSDEVFVFWTIISVLCVRFAKFPKSYSLYSFFLPVQQVS